MLAADYRGLTVAQLKQLRDRIRNEAEFSVVKNTLARRAAQDSGREEILQYLEGPTGIFWITGDPAAAAKTLTAFAKEVNGLLAIKGGVLSGTALSAAQVDALTRLPSREQLLAQLAGGIAAPLFALGGLAQPLQKLGGGLNELLAGLARTLDALRAQKSSSGSPA